MRCKFIYMFANGATSDSLIEFHEVHVVPRIGERILFVGVEGSGAVVKGIDHVIDTRQNTHEIIVYYGDE